MTLDYYNKNAASYTKETISVDFQGPRNMLLKYLNPGDHILDLGCGSGRDSKAFLDQGYKVTAIDGSKELCKIATSHIGQEVICQKFQDLKVQDTYDGVWACASLLHVPLAELGDIFCKVAKALKPGGYFYGSFKYGEFEGERNGRYFTDITKEKLQYLLKPFGQLTLIEIGLTEDARPGRQDEMWLNFIIQHKCHY